MSKTIWLVTEGEYSDFRVQAVFSTKELAEAAVAKGLGADIEDRDLDPELESPPPGMKCWQVYLDDDGNLPHYPNKIYAGRVLRPFVLNTFVGTDIRKAMVLGRSGGGDAIVHCWARDEEHAIKIANELRVQEIAKEKVLG